jgi:hypothetical protein
VCRTQDLCPLFAHTGTIELASSMVPVFHVSLLKKKLGDIVDTPKPLPPFSEDTGPIIEPLHILDYCWVKQGRKFSTEALVQWMHLTLEDATWEDTEQLQQQYSNIDLEMMASHVGPHDHPILTHDTWPWGVLREEPNM